ncbi:MAG: hypothetical protein M1818_004984 [Claussenomyces sp. TS43310]|nr:MAG: hypothetical protein M1818_004984 [Claussenomyces sp. TS43310]
MSWTGPNEGTLLVNPMIQLSTAYYLLRPFFTPISSHKVDALGNRPDEYLDPKNWQLETEFQRTIQGANPSHSQELNDVLHPHLNLSKTMVHVPRINPGDYVVWHCDARDDTYFRKAIHAVDKVHGGTTDSSVLYIPACPLTEANAQYMARQRKTFLQGTPGPDFSDEAGKSYHRGRPDVDSVQTHGGEEGLKAMGLSRWEEDEPRLLQGEKRTLERANKIPGF